MENLGVTLVIGMAILASIGLSYLDSKHKLRLVDWLIGECKNPFDSSSNSHSQSYQGSETDKQTIAELKERIATLEKIVTEPAYELNQKINRL